MSDYTFLKEISRRDFVKILAITGAGSLIYPDALLPETDDGSKAKVIIVEDEYSTSTNGINSSVVRIMIDEGIKSLTGINNLDGAWKSLLPGIDQSKTISLKVNALNRKLPTHPELTCAVADSIGMMVFDGEFYNNNNMIVFDRTNEELLAAKFTINASETGLRCFGTATPGIQYSPETYLVNGVSQNISRIITEMSDYLINLAVLKNHSIAGVTLCMKNHYGSCMFPGMMHDNNCNPYIAALNSIDPIKNKQKVFIIDALYGIINGGAGWWPEIVLNKILMGTDIVAVDYCGRKLLEDNGCQTSKDASHIDTAAVDYGLGTNNPNKIELINITAPSKYVSVNNSNYDFMELEQNISNPFTDKTTFRFRLASDCFIEMNIIDLNGIVVRQLAAGIYPAGYNTIDWDCTSNDAAKVSAGIYICRLSTRQTNKSIIIQKVD